MQKIIKQALEAIKYEGAKYARFYAFNHSYALKTVIGCTLRGGGQIIL